MAKAAETEERLMRWLDSNQQQRERLCAGLLSLDPRFTRVTLRRPKGGPDQGRDIEALFENAGVAFAAVAFVNGANDSPAQKRRIKAKFRSDLGSALGHKPDLGMFAFFTNVDLSPAEIADLQSHARSLSPTAVEIFYRERMRMALDQPSGFVLRHQYLDLPMSDDEQITFFSEFGDQLQILIARKFTDLDRSLQRIEFCADKASPLAWLQAVVTLDRAYEPAQLAPYRALFQFHRRGSSGRVPAFCLAGENSTMPAGCISPYGFRLYVGTEDRTMYDIREPHHEPRIRQLWFGGELGPQSSIPTLGSLDQHEIAIYLDESMAERLRRIEVVANVYKISTLEKKDMHIGTVAGPPWWPGNRSGPDLAPSAREVSWVEVSRATGLPFPDHLPNERWLINFYEHTPERLDR